MPEGQAEIQDYIIALIPESYISDENCLFKLKLTNLISPSPYHGSPNFIYCSNLCQERDMDSKNWVRIYFFYTISCRKIVFLYNNLRFFKINLPTFILIPIFGEKFGEKNLSFKILQKCYECIVYYLALQILPNTQLQFIIP